MNLILFEDADLGPGGELLVTGERAEHLFFIRKVGPGDDLKVGLLNGPLGMGRVLSASRTEVRLKVALGEDAPLSGLTDVVLALPRPQMLKRILQIAAAWGLKRLLLVGTAKVEKSFFHSPLLKADQLRRQLVLGLEQGVRTRMPEVLIYPKLHLFLEAAEQADLGEQNLGLLAEPGSKTHIACSAVRSRISARASIVLAVGPEGGFIEQELTAFERRGFVSVSLGEPILRVEHAFCSALAQLDLLRFMGGNES